MNKIKAYQQFIMDKQWHQALNVFDDSLADLPNNKTDGFLLDRERQQFLYHIWLDKQHDLYLQCLQRWEPLILDPHIKKSVNAWLADTLSINQQFTLANQHGTKALALDTITYNQNFFSDKQDVIAFSLFGNQPKYCETLIANALCVGDIYPNYKIAVYHDDSVPSLCLQRLASLGCLLFNVQGKEEADWPGILWRFLALENPNFDVILFRDADSVISQREKTLVDLWLAQPEKPFHIIRDWYTHTDLILAGLWGARGQLLQHIRYDIRAYIDNILKQNKQVNQIRADQLFLATYVWPKIQHLVMEHSSVLSTPTSQWPKNLPIPTNGVNAIGGSDMKAIKLSHLSHLKGFTVKIIENKAEKSAQKSTEKQVIAAYDYPDGTDTFVYPNAYSDALQSGLYSIEIATLS